MSFPVPPEHPSFVFTRFTRPTLDPAFSVLNKFSRTWMSKRNGTPFTLDYKGLDDQSSFSPLTIKSTLSGTQKFTTVDFRKFLCHTLVPTLLSLF